MVEIADTFRLHDPFYRARFRDRMPPYHLRAMEDIELCRTAALGGQLYLCDHCQQHHYSYHSCKNRHCPMCQNDQANLRLDIQRILLLPITCFMVTSTLPQELRAQSCFRQPIFYNLLFRASSDSLLRLASDPRFVGGLIGMVGVLHTWARDLRYHPHVLFITTDGCLSPDGHWLNSRSDFFVHVKPLSILYRAKFRDIIKKTDLFNLTEPQVWLNDWVVHSQPAGSGLPPFKYLAPYIFRVAIGDRRILALDDRQVSVSCKNSATDQTRYSTISAQEFIRHFLQHVPPKGFVKVRYYGLLAPSNRHLLDQGLRAVTLSITLCTDRQGNDSILLCPGCGSALRLIQKLKPRTRWPP